MLIMTAKVKCFCLNRMDIVQRQGNYPPPPGASHILGVEVSGIVEAVGKNGNMYGIYILTPVIDLFDPT